MIRKLSKTKQMKAENKIHEALTSIYTEDEVVDNFIYLTNKTRGSYTTEANIRKQYRQGCLGKLLKKYDPIYFNVQKNEL